MPRLLQSMLRSRFESGFPSLEGDLEELGKDGDKLCCFDNRDSANLLEEAKIEELAAAADGGVDTVLADSEQLAWL